MSSEQTKLKLARPTFSDRRTQGAYSTVAVDQDTSQVPHRSDIFIDPGRGKKRIKRSIGKSTDITLAPPRYLGKSHRRMRSSHYDACLRGDASRFLGTVSRWDTTIGVIGNDPTTIFAPGAIMDHTVSGIRAFTHLFPYDGIVDVSGKTQKWAGIGFSDRVSSGSRPTDVLVDNRVNVGNECLYQPHRFTVRPNQMLPVLGLGIDRDGQSVQMFLSAGTGGSQDLLNYSTDEKRTVLDVLASRMLMTPDEWMAKNGKALENMMSRLAYFQANDFVGAFSKGFRSGFWSRFTDAELEIMAELMHLGMSLRVGFPIRNCHADAFVPPHPVGTGTEDAAWQGIGVREDPSVNPLVESSSEEEEAEDDDDMITESSDTAAETDDGEAVPNTGETADWAAALDTDFDVYAVNASVNPFFLYIEDAYMGSVNDPAEQKGLYFTVDEMGQMLTPGHHEVGNESRSNRDIAFEDILEGLKWVVENTHGDMGSIWGTIGRHIRENWKDFKNADILDLYSETARTDPDSLIATWNLNQTTTTHFQRGGVVPATSVANVGRFYDANSQFLNMNELDIFKREVADLSQRNFDVAPDFMDGMQLVGDASSEVFHRTTYDGTDHFIDIKIMPHVLGHWSLVPTSWVQAESGNVYTLTSAATTGALKTVLRHGTDLQGVSNGDGPPTATDTIDVFVLATILDSLLTTDYSGYATLGNLSLVINCDITDTTRMLNWQDLANGSNTLVPHSAPSATWGYDMHGLTHVRPNLTTYYTGGAFFPQEHVSLKTDSAFYAWLNHFELVHRAILRAKDVTPWKSEFAGIAYESQNLVSLLTFNTGEPALQQMGDSIFTLGFCGRNGGWGFENKSILEMDRQIWNPLVHTYPIGRQSASPDYIGYLVPQGLDTAKLLTGFAASNILSWKLGLMGARWVLDTATSVEFGHDALRTMYRSEIFVDGSVTELSMTAWTDGFDFMSETTVTLGAGGNVLNQLNCQPGARFYQRLFTGLDETAAASADNSVCSLFGQRDAPVTAGSNVTGLVGYTSNMPAHTLQTLLRQPGVTLGSGDLLFQGFIDPEFIRVMAERNRGTDNLYFNEAGIRIAFLDQDLFDFQSAVDSCEMHDSERKMIIGPCPHLVVYNGAGEIVQELESVYDIVGSGEKAGKSKTATPDSSVQHDPPTESETPAKESANTEAGKPSL